jgi:anti-sigma factor RsiW
MAERELTCQELVELITSYLDDALTSEERQRLEHHLTYCHGCRAYLEQMRVTCATDCLPLSAAYAKILTTRRPLGCNASS